MLLLPGSDSRHAISGAWRPIMPISIKPAMTLKPLNNQRLASINIGENFFGGKVQSRFMRHFFSVLFSREAVTAVCLTYVRFGK